MVSTPPTEPPVPFDFRRWRAEAAALLAAAEHQLAEARLAHEDLRAHLAVVLRRVVPVLLAAAAVLAEAA